MRLRARTSSPSGIRDVVRSYSNPNLKYVVLVGGDSSVPFFRYPDPADLAPESWFVPPVGPGTPSEATLKSEYVLGQDEYGASTILNLGGTRFPVPEQAVGRLVETASEAKAMLDAYLVGTGASTTLKTVIADVVAGDRLRVPDRLVHRREEPARSSAPARPRTR